MRVSDLPRLAPWKFSYTIATRIGEIRTTTYAIQVFKLLSAEGLKEIIFSSHPLCLNPVHNSARDGQHWWVSATSLTLPTFPCFLSDLPLLQLKSTLTTKLLALLHLRWPPFLTHRRTKKRKHWVKTQAQSTMLKMSQMVLVDIQLKRNSERWEECQLRSDFILASVLTRIVTDLVLLLTLQLRWDGHLL